jgi:hypothetical protein
LAPPTLEEKEAMSFSLFLAFRWGRIKLALKIRF